MKNFRILLITLMTAALPAASFAFDFKQGGMCYNINDDGKTVTFTYETPILIALDAPAPSEVGYVGDIVIPETVKHNGTTYKVTAIDRYAFSANSELTSVMIPASVKTIGEGAFMQCFRLKQVTLPPALTEIPPYAFAESGINSITIPSKVKRIAPYAFNNTSLKEVSIPNSVTSIGSAAFSACRWMEKMNMGKNVKEIGEAAFSICTSLKSIKLPVSLLKIGKTAFYECSSIEEITIPAAVTEIGDGALRSCHALTSISVENGNTKYDSRNGCNAIVETSTSTIVAACKNSTIPPTVTTIGNEAFYGCRGMTSIHIPESVTKIGDQAFFYCTDLKSVEIPNSVVEIQERAFCGCDSLESVVIGNSVKSIGYGAFLHDDHIKSVTLGSAITSIKEWAFKGLDAATSITSMIQDVTSVEMGKNVFDEINTKACTLYVPRGTAQHYKVSPQWKQFTNIIEK